MKIAVMNYSGNVGKTTVAKHLLLPRMDPGCEWIPVESINEGGHADLNYKGKQFEALLRKLAELDHAVVDIGSSNIEQVFEKLRKQGDAHEDFDFFVIPTVPADKQQKDTLKIVGDLLDMDVDSSKIRIVFNQVPDDIDTARTFSEIVQTLKKMKVHVSLDSTIHDTDVFGMLLEGQSIEDAMHRDRNFKAEIAATKDIEVRRTLGGFLIASRLARGVQKELDGVWSSLELT